MRKFLNLTLILILAAVVARAALAAGPIDFSAQGARVYKAENGRSLSVPSKASPAAAVAAFLGAGDKAAGMLVVASENRTRGPTHLRLEQEVAGLPVYGLLLWLWPKVAFLNHMAITFTILITLMGIITVAKPLPEPVTFASSGEIDLTPSRPAKWLGALVIILTVLLYATFW